MSSPGTGQCPVCGRKNLRLVQNHGTVRAHVPWRIQSQPGRIAQWCAGTGAQPVPGSISPLKG